MVKYKLTDYITIFQQAGFDNTEFIAGITTEVIINEWPKIMLLNVWHCTQELIDIGVTKIGHRKKIMTGIQTSQLKEPILTKKPVRRH